MVYLCSEMIKARAKYACKSEENAKKRSLSENVLYYYNKSKAVERQ